MRAEAKPAAEVVNGCWSIDCLSGSMTDRRPLRSLTVVVDYQGLCTALEWAISIPASGVTRILDQAVETSGVPKRIRAGDGPEITRGAFEHQQCDHEIED